MTEPHDKRHFCDFHVTPKRQNGEVRVSSYRGCYHPSDPLVLIERPLRPLVLMYFGNVCVLRQFTIAATPQISGLARRIGALLQMSPEGLAVEWTWMRPGDQVDIETDNPSQVDVRGHIRVWGYLPDEAPNG